MSMMLRRKMLMQGNDTTCKILENNKILWHSGSSFVTDDKANGGVTILYKMDTPTKTLYPAGIIPTSGYVITNNGAELHILDENKTVFSYVKESTSTTYDRWAQDESGTMTEFSRSWTAAKNYHYIQFSVDIRYLDRAYMYDKTTGQIWFAGKNTPYYGLSNISQA